MKPRVLFWNARSILTKLSQFKNLLISSSPHIAGICETWLKSNTTPKFQNYDIVRMDRVGRRCGGLAFLIRKDLKKCIMPLQEYVDGQLETLAIRVAFDNGWGYFLLCYNPCKEVTKEEFDHYFKQIPSPQFILGDFNAHHRYWDPKLIKSEENSSGRALFEILPSQQCCLLNTPGLPTRIDPYSGKASTIDLCFGSGMFSTPTSFKTENNLGSDHFPVIVDFDNIASLAVQSKRPRWNFNGEKSKWDGFRENVLTHSEIHSPDNIIHDASLADGVQSKTNIIVEAGKKSFYLGSGKIFKKPAKPWWSPECSRAVAIKRRAFNKWKRRPERVFQLEYRRLEAKAKRIIRKTIRICFRDFCAKLDFSSSSSKVWYFIKKIAGIENTHSFPLSQNGVLLIEDLAKAELLADFYVTIIGVDNSIANEDNLKAYVDKCLQEESENLINRVFIMNEMQTQIRNLKNKKACGFDMIANEMISNLPEEFQEIILNLFNKSWVEGNDPLLWKFQEVIPVLKPNKDPSDVSSYRSISLISCLGKLMEKMVQARLLWWLENSTLLPDNQCGFRPGRSTIDVLLQLEHGVFKGFREKKVTLVIFFDISKAFDKASPLGILCKLCVMGLRGNILRWLKSFFEDRFFQVLVGNQRSSSHQVKTGVPQGSVLSPLLFSILLYDIPQFTDVVSLILADDITFYTTADTVDDAQLKLQKAVDKFLEWITCWGLNINPSKSKLMCFTRKRINSFPIIKVNNNQVDFVMKHCFLGLFLDGPYLTWKYHIEYLRDSCMKRIDMMKRIAGKSWGSNYKSLIIFYKSYIRSKLDYGCILYNSASQVLLKKLDVIQSAALRIATGAFKSSPIIALHVETNIPPLPYWRKMRIATGYLKIQNSNFNHPLFQLFSRDLNYMQSLNWASNRQVPFLIRASYLLNTLGQNWSEFMNTPVVSPLPPWFSIDIYVAKDFPVNAKNFNPVFVRQIFSNFCSQEYENFTQIYTDGSKYTSPNSCSAALYIPDFDYTDKWHLPSQSIVTAELFGILKALQFSIKFLKNSNIVIFTDSLDALSLIKGYSLAFRVLLFPIHSCLEIISDNEMKLIIQ